MPTASPIQVVSTGHLFKLTRPGARWVIDRRGCGRDNDEHQGVWLANAVPSFSLNDAFPEYEARALLPLLRALESRAPAVTPP